MAQTVVILCSNDCVIDQNGDYRSGATYIPVGVENISIKMTRELTVLPIPVFGIAAAIDYNVRRSVITLENIILADGDTNGNSIYGNVDGTKGWVIGNRKIYVTDGLNRKELQRSAFSLAAGLTWTEQSLVAPKINRIIWGEANLGAITFVELKAIKTGDGTSITGHGEVVFSNVLVTSATIKEVGGEPTKYECTLEASLIGLGGGKAENELIFNTSTGKFI